MVLVFDLTFSILDFFCVVRDPLANCTLWHHSPGALYIELNIMSSWTQNSCLVSNHPGYNQLVSVHVIYILAESVHKF